MSWYEFKLLLVTYTGLEKDALHIHVALLLYILAMVLFRQTRRSRFPWLFVLAVELINEIIDLNKYPVVTDAAWHDSAKDIWNTMLWPTVLLFVGRYTNLFEHRSWTRERDEKEGDPARSAVPEADR